MRIGWPSHSSRRLWVNTWYLLRKSGLSTSTRTAELRNKLPSLISQWSTIDANSAMPRSTFWTLGENSGWTDPNRETNFGLDRM